MKRNSLELTALQWERLNKLAALTGSKSQSGPKKGQASWRTMIRLIADGKISIKVAEKGD